MSKCAARLQIGWLDEVFEGEEPRDIVSEAEQVQDFGCLLRMGAMMEGPEGQGEIKKLRAFLDKYSDGSLTLEDIRDLDVRLGPGYIFCKGVAAMPEGIEALRSK